MAERISIHLAEPVGWGTSSAKGAHAIKNLRSDVEQVQRALLLIGLENVKATGTVTGPLDLTVQAINMFQKHEFGWCDGVVDPGRNTENRMNAILGFAGPFPAPPPPPNFWENPKVWEHINRELTSYARLSESERLWTAAAALKSERNKKGPDGKPKNCGNKPLAYAEHYMLARA